MCVCLFLAVFVFKWIRRTFIHRELNSHFRQSAFIKIHTVEGVLLRTHTHIYEHEHTAMWSGHSHQSNYIHTQKSQFDTKTTRALCDTRSFSFLRLTSFCMIPIRWERMNKPIHSNFVCDFSFKILFLFRFRGARYTSRNIVYLIVKKSFTTRTKYINKIKTVVYFQTEKHSTTLKKIHKFMLLNGLWNPEREKKEHSHTKHY